MTARFAAKNTVGNSLTRRDIVRGKTLCECDKRDRRVLRMRYLPLRLRYITTQRNEAK